MWCFFATKTFWLRIYLHCKILISICGRAVSHIYMYTYMYTMSRDAVEYTLCFVLWSRRNHFVAVQMVGVRTYVRAMQNDVLLIIVCNRKCGISTSSKLIKTRAVHFFNMYVNAFFGNRQYGKCTYTYMYFKTNCEKANSFTIDAQIRHAKTQLSVSGNPVAYMHIAWARWNVMKQ